MYQIINRAIEARRRDRFEDALANNCVPNAVRVAEVARDAGCDATIYRGGLDIPDKPTPTTAEEIPETGLGHWWTEVTADGETYVIDLAPMPPVEVDGPLVASETPDGYLPFETNPTAWETYCARTLP